MKPLALLFLIASIFSSLQAQDICYWAGKNDFREVEKIMKLRVKELRGLKALKSNREKLDSLENWLNSQSCVRRAYWNKNDGFTLITLTFTRNIGVEFKVNDSIVEMCYEVRTQKQKYGDWYYWHWGWDIPDNRLTYLGSQNCTGFIQLRVDTDSSNARSMRLQRNNYSIRIDMQPVNYNQGHAYSYRPIEEGNPIYIMFTIRNVSGEKKRMIWPKQQNHGKKAIYFELLDKRERLLYTEDRNLFMAHNETIPFDVLTLDSGETKVFYHMIDGCSKRLAPVECSHSLGVLQEGEYKLRAIYNPYIYDFAEDENLWLLRGQEFIRVGSHPSFRVIRSNQYQRQLYSVKYNKEATNYDRAEVVGRVKVISPAANYLYVRGQHHYDALAVVEDSVKGGLSPGDTIAFSFRHGLNGEQGMQDEINVELIKSEISIGSENSYWIYATHSMGSYYQMLAGDSRMNLKGKRNYQLINYPGAIQKVEKHQPKVSINEK